ncbi:uncharacterized protein LOC133924933 isoform X2 [Phragmites australis]|uniref:uncharacterized protein LOC133924933 isoform X2 n=1 Tax=Phragmites australis TaxID=29695 RepID=UPI002D7680F7|nr:uncharacterized protein LOC133924933 isoform X2 [Phragmites australis]
MANSRDVLIAAVILCSCFVRIRCDAISVSPSHEQEQEVQMLRSKVASLELSSSALEDEISRRKEETLQLESVVRERTAQMAALVGKLEVPQVNVADDESVMKASKHNAALQKQIERLGSDLEDQVRKGESLEVRATEAEETSHELRCKLESVEKTNIEQRKKLRELEGKLQHAQDELAELEKEEKSKAEELEKVHGMWLPHWLAVHVDLASAKWHVHGKPVFDPPIQKVAEKLSYARQLMEPHLQTIQNKLVPIAKVHINSLWNTTASYVSAVATKSTAAYRVCRDAMQPCMIKAKESSYHHWQESKKFTQPYITQIVAASEPHLSRASVVLEPYLMPVTSIWRRLVASTSVYHRQVQRGVKHYMDDNELLKPLSTDRLAWATASALFVLPMFSIYKILSAAFCKKIQATQGSGRSGPSNRKHKRRADM